MMKNSLSVYIHIPFCQSRCYYCDFCSSLIDKSRVEKYMQALKQEITLYEDVLQASTIETIFFGGGTPSAIDSFHIGEILEQLYGYSVHPDCEITVECNPNSITRDKMKDYKSFGINRISMGAQSFSDSLLRTIGRIHTAKDIFQGAEIIFTSGISNWNLDLMSGLPGQTLSDISASLREIETLNPTHLSYYSLIVEDNTPMQTKFQQYPQLFPSEEEDRKMYHVLCSSLKSLGYHQYELSNFAQKGRECRHNLAYWKLKDYLGLGLSAHSNLGMRRFANTSSFSQYFHRLGQHQLPTISEEFLTPKERLNEYFMLRLRLSEGVSSQEIAQQFHINLEEEYRKELDKNFSLGRLQECDGRYFLTEKGRDFANQVELDFFR